MLRMSVRRFTRLTNAFSKSYKNHCHMVAIYFAYYNFCRVHQTLRVSPAMESGLADHVWSLEELVGFGALLHFFSFAPFPQSSCCLLRRQFRGYPNRSGFFASSLQ